MVDPPSVDLEFVQARKAHRAGRGPLAVEEEWERYRRICPEGQRAFLSLARSHFRGARWQMHATLLASALPGFTPGKREGGPDFYVAVDGKRCGVECTSIRLTDNYPTGLPKPGEMVSGRTYFSGPQYYDYRLARLGRGLRSKGKDRERFVKKGLLAEDEPFVIAISLGELDYHPDELPDALCAAYGIGQTVYLMPVDPRTGIAGEGRYERPTQLFVRETPGSPLEDNQFFRNGDYNGVSAIIYSPFCHDAYGAGDGRELSVIHNVFATSPLLPGAFPLGIEWGRNGHNIARINDWRMRDGRLGSPGDDRSGT